jgi:hypothetical protein
MAVGVSGLFTTFTLQSYGKLSEKINAFIQNVKNNKYFCIRLTNSL